MTSHIWINNPATGAVFSGVNLGPLETPRRSELNMEMINFIGGKQLVLLCHVYIIYI